MGIRDTVTVRIPTDPGYLSLLRTAVGGYAARDQFTLDQVDDLRMAVEESAVQLLRRVDEGVHLQLDVTTTDEGLEVRLHAPVTTSRPIIDEDSFSWMILRALADELTVDTTDGVATVVLAKHRIIVSRTS